MRKMRKPTASPSKNQAIQTTLVGNWEKAVKLNRVIIKNDPKDIEALNRLAFALTILGNIRNAKSTYKKVLKIDSLNPIALRNLKRLTSQKVSFTKLKKNGLRLSYANRTFLEESGKTKIVELINIAPPRIISGLRIGQLLTIHVKRLKIFIQDENREYLGVLPDDIGKRLIKFIKGGNLYEAYVKSCDEHHVVVFIKEEKRVARFKDQPSFAITAEKSLGFEKNKLKYAQEIRNEEES